MMRKLSLVVLAIVMMLSWTALPAMADNVGGARVVQVAKKNKGKKKHHKKHHKKHKKHKKTTT